MDKRYLTLISPACLVLATLILTAIAGAAQTERIDPALIEQMRGNQDDRIPVIVIFKGQDNPNLNGLDVKYRYNLINGVAGLAKASDIFGFSESLSVQGIYFDGSAKVETPGEGEHGSDLLCPARNINADKLWQEGIDGQGVVVAVIDSGIDRNHPDLVGKVVGEKNFVEDEASANDLLGHGTMVAGIIAGSGEASGGKYKGIAPGASLLNVKVIDREGNGKMSDIIAAIEWAMYNGADVLSLSLGGLNLGETNPPITMAADNAMDAGTVVCVAAGNRNNTKLEGLVESSSQIRSYQEPGLVEASQKDKDVLLLLVPIVLALPPGLIDSPGDGVELITVGASDCEGHMASFSGSGPTRDGRTKPDVVGPGMDVVSTIPPGLQGPEYLDIYHAKESGTSLSTPAVAGLAALLLQADPDLTPAGVKAAVIGGARKLNNTLGEEYEEYYQGAGLMDAHRSYQLLNQDLCGVIPDKWNAGRWAYLPAGEGIYVGLDAGADRPQKKLYALAPEDEDWDTEFVFFTDNEKSDLQVSLSGEVSDWIALQPLSKSIPANGQKVFGASLTVPNGTLPGVYSGSLDIKEKGQSICSLPVSVEVAEAFEIARGRGSREGTLQGSDWRYYYLDVPLGTSELDARLKWKNSSSNLDLFFLSPTSEYYAGEQKGSAEDLSIEYPPSGRWLLAVHSEKLPYAENYSLEIERSLIDSFPKRWNLESASPGMSTRMLFTVENRGQALENLSYKGIIENITALDLKGSVKYKEIWESTINVTNETVRLSAKLSIDDEDNLSQILFLFEDPQGQPIDADLDTGDLGPIEVSRPEPGEWKIRVYGYDVPDEGQPFEIRFMKYSEEAWDWISTTGPKRIESDSNGTIEAVLSIPDNTSTHRLSGYLEISSDQQSFQIPVSVTVAGTSLEGLKSTDVEDENQDGYFDALVLSFEVKATSPGEYILQGVLTDCSGNMIEELKGSATPDKSGKIEIEVNGSDIWTKGKCGPLKIENLILYDRRGDLIDRYQDSIILDRDPKNFQPPEAYLTGSFLNQTTSNKIAVGINISVIRPGSYQLSGRLVDDRGEEMGKDTVSRKLDAGNTTLTLDFNPTKFTMMGKSSHLHLVDLVLSRNGQELDRRKKAWSSEVMSTRGFRSGSIAAKSTNTSNSSLEGGIKRENGKIVISQIPSADMLK